MTDFSEYVKYSVDKTMELLAIDSPTCFTKAAVEWLHGAFAELGYDVQPTVKGGILIDLGGAENDAEGALMIQAHADTLGCMIAEIKANGRLRLARLGGMRAANAVTENVRVYTRDGRIYEGTCQLVNASTHVNTEFENIVRTYDNIEIVLDENVSNLQETRALGIEVGDIVCFEPRSRVTASGYIKSRFLDDKLCCGILLGFAKYLRDCGATLPRRTYIHITVYEEVGFGGSSSVPSGVTEVLAMDMGCVGDGLTCTERMVSICAKDAEGPYNYEMVGKLIDAAKRESADYAVGVYPRYSSDVETTLTAGYDIRHGLIGPGIYASHGYERGHTDGVLNTLRLLKGYLQL